MDKTIDQWEWSKLRDLSEKHMKGQMDKLTRYIERIRQYEEREEEASYKALTCTADQEYWQRECEDALQSNVYGIALRY